MEDLIQNQLTREYRKKFWNEQIVYIGIGSHVKKNLSVDQQIPAFLHPFYKVDNEITIRAKIFLFDPNFLNDIPLSISLEQEQWRTLGKRTFQRGNVLLYVSSATIDEECKWIDRLRTYIKELLEDDGHVIMGFFAVPVSYIPPC